MLSPADHDLVRRDTALAGLSVLLDQEALRGALYDALAGVPVGDVEISYLRYKPRMNCLARFTAHIDGMRCDGYAKAYGPDAHDKLAKADERLAIPAPFVPGRITIERYGLEVVFFPNDNKLKALANLNDPDRRISLLGRRLLARRPDLRGASLSCLQYKPERRYVTRLDVCGEPSAVLRLYSRREYASLPHGTAEWTRARTLRLPRQIRRSDRRAMLVYEWVPGQPLTSLLPRVVRDLSLVEQVGASLAQLHSQPAGGLPPYWPGYLQQRLEMLERAISVLCPHLAGRVNQLAGRLQDDLRRCDHLGPVHGDFHPRQVLVDAGRIAIIDLDEARIGDPAVDLGLFIAHLEREALRGHLTAGTVDGLWQALLAGYQTVRTLPPRDHLEAYTAYGLLTLSPHSFRVREPDWSERTEALLSRAEQMLDRRRAGDRGLGVVL